MSCDHELGEICAARLIPSVHVNSTREGQKAEQENGRHPVAQRFPRSRPRGAHVNTVRSVGSCIARLESAAYIDAFGWYRQQQFRSRNRGSRRRLQSAACNLTTCAMFAVEALLFFSCSLTYTQSASSSPTRGLKKANYLYRCRSTSSTVANNMHAYLTNCALRVHPATGMNHSNLSTPLASLLRC